jgi:trigger factor
MGIPQDKINENIEKLRASAADESARELKMSFISEAVAEKLDVTVSDAEVNGWIAQIAMRQRRRPEKIRDELRKDGRLADLEMTIRQEKAVDKILEMADVVDAPLETEPAKKTGTKKKKTVKKATKKTSEKADDSSDESAKPKQAKKTKAKKEAKRKPPSSD